MSRFFRRNSSMLITAIVIIHVLVQISFVDLSVQPELPINALLDLLVVVLLAMIWRGSWVKFLADPTEQKRYVFYAFTVVNLRQYLDLVPPPWLFEVLADFLSLTTVYFMLRSQARTILLSEAKQRWVHRFYLSSTVTLFGIGLVLAGFPAATTIRLLYVLVFTGSHLVIVSLLFFWYYLASLTSSDPLVGWRFRFLVVAALAYFSMFVFNMVATVLGRYDLPGWSVTYLSIKTVLIVVGLYSIYLAFSMGAGLTELLLKISARYQSPELWEDLILLAARLSDVVASKPGNIVAVYALSLAERLRLPEERIEVLHSAADTAYFLWQNELPELSITGIPAMVTDGNTELSSPDSLFAEQLFHLRAVSRVLREVEQPYDGKWYHRTIESQILRVVLDYLRFDDLGMLKREAGKVYAPQVVSALIELLDVMENMQA